MLTEYKDMELLMNTNLTVTGSLVLLNCTLTVTDPVDPEAGLILFKVEDGGSISMINSSIVVDHSEPQTIDDHHIQCRFNFAANSSVHIHDSELYRPKRDGMFTRPRLLSLSNNLTISASTINDFYLTISGLDSLIQDCSLHPGISIKGLLGNNFITRARILNNMFTSISGVSLDHSSGNCIEGNNIDHGTVHLLFSDNNTIRSNSIKGSTVDIDSGVTVASSNNNTITLNNVSLHDGNGICVRSFSQHNTISFNNIYSNFGYGIVLIDANVVITRNNTIYFNGLGPIQTKNVTNVVFEGNTDYDGNEIFLSNPNDPDLFILVLLPVLGVVLVVSVLIVKKKVQGNP
ncbi:MAG: right-handed parallel beta-helix repeat-containing protein [Candidatus Hodarchaeales archaeon]